MDTEIARPDIVSVSFDLKPLLPRFLDNRINEISEMKTLLEEFNYPDIARIAHGFKGVCGSFGFDAGFEFADRIERLAEISAYGILKNELERLESHFNSVAVEFTEERI